jgi:hypothetical protein
MINPKKICYEMFSLLPIEDAYKISKAFPRTFGAFIESNQVIRFKNAIKSAPSPLFHRVLNGSESIYSFFHSWLKPRVLSLLKSYFLNYLRSSR